MPQEEVGPFVSKIKAVFSKIFGIPVPTIAAIDGELEANLLLIRLNVTSIYFKNKMEKQPVR